MRRGPGGSYRVIVTTEPNDDLLSLAEVGDVLGISVQYAKRLADKGLLGPSCPDGRLERAAVFAYEDRRRSGLEAVAKVTLADIAAGCRTADQTASASSLGV